MNKQKIFLNLLGFTLLLTMVFTACEKESATPNDPFEPVPVGGSVSGVLHDQNQNSADSLLIEPVSGRFTTIDGFSFVASNDKLVLYFYLPAVSDTGLYHFTNERDYYFQLLLNGDTINGQQSSILIDIDTYEVHQNYSLVSGTFSGHFVYGQDASNYVWIDGGTFENIPISNTGETGNYAYYKGERMPLTETKAFITERERIFTFKIPGASIRVTDFITEENFPAWTRLDYYQMSSDLVIDNLNATEQKVSGEVKTREDFDLEVHYKDASYDVFPEVDDGDMVLVYNFGEEIIYFDSVKYVIPPLETDYILAYSGNKHLKMSKLFSPSDPNPTHGHVMVYNTGFTILPDEFSTHGFIYLSSNNTSAYFEAGRIGNAVQFRPLSILGKNIPVEM